MTSNVSASRFSPRTRRALVEALDARVLMSVTPHVIINPGDPGDIPADTYEPNNSFAAASDLGALGSKAMTGLTIDNQQLNDDLDFYKFTAAATGTEVVTVNDNLNGRLTMKAFNGAQGQIGTVTTSSNSKSLALNVTAGQTYYMEVQSSTVGGVNKAYSLSFSQAGASFAWSMASHFGDQLDAQGLPVVPNTPGYVRPNPTSYFGTNFDSTYTVHLNGTASVGSTPTYDWAITGGPLASNTLHVASLAPDVQLPQGTYTVTFSATGTAGTYAQTQTVTVRDYLIVAMGDSYICGEGNPNRPVEYDAFGFVKSGVRWAQGGDAATTDDSYNAHRSSYAGAVQAALDLENADPHTSVTFVFVAQSGAKIENGILNSWTHTNQDGTTSVEPAQLPQVVGLVGNRHIDSLLLSIGGNDVDVPAMLGNLVLASPGDTSPDYSTNLNSIWNTFNTNLNLLKNRYYPELQSAIRQQLNVDPSNVLLCQYPDPAYAPGGSTIPIIGDVLGGKSVDVNEVTLARQKCLVPMAQLMGQFAYQSGWTYLKDISANFNFNGYGYWFRTASESAVMQGPCGNSIIGPLPTDKENTQGTCHPNAQGQLVYRDAFENAWNLSNLTVTNFALTDGTGALHGSANTPFTFTVKNTSFRITSGTIDANVVLRDELADLDVKHVLLTVQVPALAPGQTWTYSGVIPPQGDPYHTTNNYFVGVTLNVNTGAANEFNYNDNYLSGAPFINYQPVVGDADMTATPYGTLLLPQNPPPLAAIGQTSTGTIGDELAGRQDMDFFQFTVTAAMLNKPYLFTINAPTGSGLTPGFQVTNQLSINVDPFSYQPVPTGLILGTSKAGIAPGAGATPAGANAWANVTFTNAGTYYVVVSDPVNANYGALFTLANRADGSTGVYAVGMQAAPVVVPVNNVVNAVAGQANTITFKHDASGNFADVWINGSTSGTPTQRVDLTQPITVNGGGGVDALVLDTSAGAVLSANLTLNGSFTTANALSIIAGQSLVLGASLNGGNTLTVPGLTLDALSVIDLNNNGLIVDYATGAASPLSTLAARVKAGYAGGVWSATGITSTTAALHPGVGAVGFGEASTALKLTGSQTATFMGRTVDASSLLLRYTVQGDATLDGKVDFADFVALSNRFGQVPLEGWDQADFNFDGKTDFSDFVSLSNHFGQSVPLNPAAAQTRTDGRMPHGTRVPVTNQTSTKSEFPNPRIPESPNEDSNERHSE